jgi:hypothetical protein
MKAFGRVITNGQAAALVLCGADDVVVDFKALVLIH